MYIYVYACNQNLYNIVRYPEIIIINYHGTDSYQGMIKLLYYCIIKPLQNEGVVSCPSPASCLSIRISDHYCDFFYKYIDWNSLHVLL